MKKIQVIILCLCSLLLIEKTYAQRYAVIDAKYILDKMPAYKEANLQLEQMVIDWQKEVDKKQYFVDSLAKDFESEKYMLNDELKQKRITQIDFYRQELLSLNKKYFGFEGELFKQRARLMRPIQDRLYNTIQQMSIQRGWDIVFDKSEGTNIFYNDPKLNKSDEILEAMGIKDAG